MNSGEKKESLIELYNMNNQALILATTSNKLYSISAGNNPTKPLVLSSYNIKTKNWDQLEETRDVGIERIWDPPVITFDDHRLEIHKKTIGEEKTNALIAKLKKIQDKALEGCAHMQTKQDLEKAIKVIPTKINSIDELLVPKQKGNPQDLNINPAEGKKIFFTSDIEGRYDLYLRFLIDIGALDADKLPQKAKKLLVETNTSPLYMTDGELNTLLNIDVASCLNPNFHDKILFNGDFVSGRPMHANYNRSLGKIDVRCHDGKMSNNDKQRCDEIDRQKGSPQYRTDMSITLAEKCYELFQTLQNTFHEDCILIAGNHDIYNYAPLHDLHLEDVKNKILRNLNVRRYYHIKTEDGGHIIFKHSPWANDEQLEEMLTDKNQFLPKKNIFDPKHDYNGNNELNVFSSLKDDDAQNELVFYEKLEPVDNELPIGPEYKNRFALEKSNMDAKRCFVIHGHTHGIKKTHDLMICCDDDVHRKNNKLTYFTLDEFGNYTLKNSKGDYMENIGEKIDKNKYNKFFDKTDLKQFAIAVTKPEDIYIYAFQDRIQHHIAGKLLELYKKNKEKIKQKITNYENQPYSTLVNLLYDGSPNSPLVISEIASAICSLFIFSDNEDIIDFTYNLVKCFNKEKTEELFNKNDNFNYEKREEILLMALIINEYYEINKRNKISKEVEQIINNIKNFRPAGQHSVREDLNTYIDGNLKKLSVPLINEMVKIQQQLIAKNYQEPSYTGALENNQNNQFNPFNNYFNNQQNELSEKENNKTALLSKIQEIMQNFNKYRQERKKRIEERRKRRMWKKKNMSPVTNENKIKKKTNELDPDIKKEEEKTEKLQKIYSHVNNYLNKLIKLNEYFLTTKKENKFIPFYNQLNKNIIQNNNERNNHREIESSLAYTLQRAKNMLNI